MKKDTHAGGGSIFTRTPKQMAKAFLVVMLMLCNVGNGFATDINWKGSATDSIRKMSSGLLDQNNFLEQIPKTDYSNTFVLYNVGAKKFVYCGGSWGTQPILSDKALRFAISQQSLFYGATTWQNNTYHVLTSTVGSPQGFWLGSKGTAESLFLDCEEGDISKLSDLFGIENINLAKYKNVALNPQPVKNSQYNGTNTYIIRTLYDASDIDKAQGAEKYYLYVDMSKNDPDGNKGCIVLKNYYDTGGNAENNCTHNSSKKQKYHDDAACDIMKDPYAMWRFVSIDEIKKTLKKLNPKDMDEPFDCTFFLKDADFCRYNRDNGWDVWPQGQQSDRITAAVDITPKGGQKGDQGWKMGLDYVYSSSLNDTKDESRYGWGNHESWDKDKKKDYQEKYAKYFCAQVTGLCKDNKTPVNLDQNWTCEKDGWYRVTCQGFVKDGSSYMYAKVADKANGTTLRYQSVQLRDINDFDLVEGGRSSSAENIENLGDYSGKMLTAGMMFYKGQYTNTLYIYVEEGKDLEIGVRFRGTNTTWTCIDDFRLAYIGNDHTALVLDEDYNNLAHIVNANSEYENFKGNMLALHRTFVKNTWNTIVMPVDLTRSQCNDLFGKNSQVAKMIDYNSETGRIKFVRTENESTADNTTIMKANCPYIIYPTINWDDEMEEDDKVSSETFLYKDKDGNDLHPSITTPYTQTHLNVNQAADMTYIKNTQDWGNDELNVTGYMYNSLFFRGTLITTYDKDATNAADRYKLDLLDKYIIYNGSIRHIPTSRAGYGMKGLRGYFEIGKPSAVKVIKLNINGVDEDADNATGIDELFGSDFVNVTGNGKVYNLSGQVVSTNGSTEGLASGIYIVKGKKVVVK